MPPFIDTAAATTVDLIDRAEAAADELAELRARLADRADCEEYDGGARW